MALIEGQVFGVAGMIATPMQGVAERLVVMGGLEPSTYGL